MTVAEQVKDRLVSLAPVSLVVHDESHRHLHHAEGKSGAHLRLEIVSAAFSSLSVLARHQLIYQTLGDLNALGIHALAIDAQAPE